MKRTGAILTALIRATTLTACGGEKSGTSKACEITANVKLIRNVDPHDVPAKLTEYSFCAKNVVLQHALSGMPAAYTTAVSTGESSEISLCCRS